MEFINSLIFGSTKPILIINIVIGVIAWANPASGNLFECANTELIGKHLSEIHPNDELEVILEQLQGLPTAKGNQVTNVQMLTSTGKMKQVIIAKAKTFEIDMNSYMLIYYKDI